VVAGVACGPKLRLAAAAAAASVAALALGGPVLAATATADLSKPVAVVANISSGVQGIGVDYGVSGFPVTVSASGVAGSSGALPPGDYYEVLGGSGAVVASGQAAADGSFSAAASASSGSYTVEWSSSPFSAMLTDIGSMFPAGTSASGSSEYSPNVFANAIDGNLSTFWSASGTSGSLVLTFSSPVELSSLGIEAGASPATYEDYVIDVESGGVWRYGVVSVVEYIVYPANSSQYNFFVVSLPSAYYQAVEISVSPSSCPNGLCSWPGIFEVTANPPASGYPATVPSNGVIG